MQHRGQCDVMDINNLANLVIKIEDIVTASEFEMLDRLNPK